MRGLHLARHVAAEGRGHGPQARRDRAVAPASALAARRTAAASALPPPGRPRPGSASRSSPAAAASAAPGAAARNAASAAAARFAAATPGQTTSSAPASSTTDVVGEVERGEERADGVQPVLAGPADVQEEVDLRGGALPADHRRRSPTASERWPSACQPREVRAAPAARRARRRGARARRAPPGHGRAALAAPGARASDPGSALRRCAKAAWTSAATAGSGAGPCGAARISADSTFGAGWKTVGETRRRTRDLAGELRQHRSGPVGLAPGVGRQTLAHLALHHRHPEGDVGQLLHRAQQHRRRHAVGQVGDHLPGGGSSDARSRRTASARCSVELGNGSSASRSGGSSERSTSTTCRCVTRGARYSDSTPSPPPTSSTTSAGSSSAARAITPSRLSSIRKF